MAAPVSKLLGCASLMSAGCGIQLGATEKGLLLWPRGSAGKGL